MPKEKLKFNIKDRLEDNVLDLSLSEIEHVPVKEIASLRRATHLDLSTNNIKILPKNFGTLLVQLTRIDLSKNELKFLPDDFGSLVNLKHLDLYNNQLENLPVSFGKLSKLRYLDLKDNQLHPDLQTIVGLCISSKDCCDAAKSVVPYYIKLEKRMEIERQKKAEKEEKERLEEAERHREQVRLAKKAARKERVMLERQKKAEEEEKLLSDKKEEICNGTEKQTHQLPSNLSTVSSILKFIKSLLLIFTLLIVLSSFMLKIFPEKAKSLIASIPDQYKAIIYESFKKINENVFNFYEKIIK